MAKQKKKSPGRPEMPEKDRKKPFPTKLHPSIIDRVARQAVKEGRSRNNLVERILDENLEA